MGVPVSSRRRTEKLVLLSNVLMPISFPSSSASHNNFVVLGMMQKHPKVVITRILPLTGRIFLG